MSGWIIGAAVAAVAVGGGVAYVVHAKNLAAGTPTPTPTVPATVGGVLTRRLGENMAIDPKHKPMIPRTYTA